MINVRPYTKQDYRFVEDICMATSQLADDDNAINRATMCAMYCDYYMDNEPEFCFVATDDDTIAGYIVCAADCDTFAEQMDGNYMPLVRKLNRGAYFRFSAERKLDQRYIKAGFTAHLRIDVLPEFASSDAADKLLTALETKLVESFVEGVYVVCPAKDKDTIAFYQKHGYDDIDYISGAVVYGKKLFSED